MNCLLVDLGNSRIKWAALNDDALGPSASALHRDGTMTEVLDHAWGALDAPAAVHGASVVAVPIRAEIDAWIAHSWGCPVSWAASQPAALGVTNGYHEPARLGVDRWLALLGAWRRSPSAACVVDCGSAVTVDILDAQGRHLGGWIAPGLQMMRAALQRDTALPLAQGPAQAEPGHDTNAAIVGGTLLAAVGLVEQAMRYAPASARLLLTGGDAGEIAQHLGRPYELCPDLVLEGLAGTLEGV